MLWRSVEGERFLLGLLGHDIEQAVHQRRSLGHSQVLASENRNTDGARLVARRLVIKAATRLRRDHYFTTRLTISVKDKAMGRSERSARFSETQDSFELLKTFAHLWNSIHTEDITQPKSVNIMLSCLVAEDSHSHDLFAQPEAEGSTRKYQSKTNPLQKQIARQQLSIVVDELNQIYGRDSLIYGEQPVSTVKYTGAKIAFNRVPDAAEFCD